MSFFDPPIDLYDVALGLYLIYVVAGLALWAFHAYRARREP